MFLCLYFLSKYFLSFLTASFFCLTDSIEIFCDRKPMERKIARTIKILFWQLLQTLSGILNWKRCFMLISTQCYTVVPLITSGRNGNWGIWHLSHRPSNTSPLSCQPSIWPVWEVVHTLRLWLNFTNSAQSVNFKKLGCFVIDRSFEKCSKMV